MGPAAWYCVVGRFDLVGDRQLHDFAALGWAADAAITAEQSNVVVWDGFQTDRGRGDYFPGALLCGSCAHPDFLDTSTGQKRLRAIGNGAGLLIASTIVTPFPLREEDSCHSFRTTRRCRHLRVHTERLQVSRLR